MAAALHKDKHIAHDKRLNERQLEIVLLRWDSFRWQITKQ